MFWLLRCPVKAIWAIPEDVLTQPKEKISKLAALLGMTESSLYAKRIPTKALFT